MALTVPDPGLADDLTPTDPDKGATVTVKLSEIVGECSSWNKRVATAVALSESSGDPDAENYCCTGLMQVHEIHAGKGGSPKDKAEFRKWLKNPYNNIKIACMIYNDAGDWTPWEGYTNGAYRKYLGHDHNVLINASDAKDGIEGAINDVTDAVTDVTGIGALLGILKGLTQAATWARIGKTALGGVLIVLGVGSLVFIVATRVQKTTVARAVGAV